MEDRLDRLQERAAKRRQIAKDVMVELDLKKITAPDFTVSIRPGMPALMVIDEARCPASIGSRASPAQPAGLVTTLNRAPKSPALPSPIRNRF